MFSKALSLKLIERTLESKVRTHRLEVVFKVEIACRLDRQFVNMSLKYSLLVAHSAVIGDAIAAIPPFCSRLGH